MLRVDLYRGEDAFRTDRTQVLRRSWQFVGHEAMAPRPGDYLAQEVGGAPVVVVRNAEGRLAAFHNVCRHRAGALVPDGEGRCGEALVCRYHGWRYALDGRLRSATDFGAAADFDPRQYGLFPVQVHTWRGLIFVNLDLDAAPLAEALAPLAGEAPFPAFPLIERRSHVLACNWKAYVENYLEGYHLPMVHPEFDADVVVADYEVKIEGQVIFQSAPPRDASVYAGTWAWLWPNLAINTYRHGYMIERMTAVGPEATRLDYFYFFDPARTAQLAQMFVASDRVTAQDKQVCEEVQRNLRTGIYQGGVLSPKHERGVAWFQARIAAAHGEPGTVKLSAVS
jgi:choline monooxygenase